MAKDVNRHHIREHKQMTNMHVKKMRHAMCHRGNTKYEQQWDLTTHLWEWPKSIRLRIPNAAEEVEQLECSFIVSRNAKL